MGAIETKTFQTSDGVAVQLPEMLGITPGALVTVEQVGDTIEIRPVPEKKITLAEALAQIKDVWKDVPPGTGRGEREPIEFPDRPGLY